MVTSWGSDWDRKGPSRPWPGHGDQRDSRGQDDGDNDPDHTAFFDVLLVDAVHSEVNTRRTGRGEEADDGADHGQDASERAAVGLGCCCCCVRERGAAEQEEAQEQNQKRNDRHVRGYLGDVLNALQSHERGPGRPEHAQRIEQLIRMEPLANGFLPIRTY